MSIIKIENISKYYIQNKFILKDISFGVEDNDFIVLLGPSGCGKSTLLNIIAGLTEITSGKLIINDKISNDISPKERNIAMVFQNYSLYPHMSVYDNIAFPLRNRRIAKSEIEKQVISVAERLRISDILKSMPYQISGGQKQRVAIGRAIVRRPTVFLMDEPLSNLDTSLKLELRSELRALHKTLKIPFIYVTHDQSEALSLATKIVILNNGTIQQIGKPEEIYHHPINEFVATFIGTPKINLLENVPIHYDDRGAFLLLFGQKIVVPNLTPGIDSIDIGIRPRDISFIEKTNTAGIPFEIEDVEYLGNEFIYHGFCMDPVSLSRYSINMISQLQVNLEKHSELFISIPHEKVYLFNTISKQNIML